MHTLSRTSGANSGAGSDLLERGPVQLELSRLLHDASRGSSRLVFLGGEAGIGKTSLVRRFAALVGERARLLAGACDPLSTPRPFGPLFDMEPQLGRRYAQMLGHSVDRDAVFRGFLAELSATGGPALVVFEDVHWADDATLDLLRFLGRRLEGARALIVATYRTEEVGARHPLRMVLGDLAAQPAVQRLALEPLSLAAVQMLVGSTGMDAERLHRQTSGNPFYVTEAIAAGGTGIPETVRDAVLARAGRLSADGRATLDAAAVLGFRFEPWLLERVAGATAEAIDDCLAGGMLRVEGDRFAFHHELAREALLQALPPHRGRAFHQAALDALRTVGEDAADAGRLAHHAEGAGDGAAVIEYAPRAARRARELSARREAAAQFARALRFADRLSGPERAQLWEEYSWECAATDDWEEAIRADYELIAAWRAEGNKLREGWSLSFLVGCLATVCRLDEAEEAIRASVALLETLPPSPELAEAWAMQSLVLLLKRDFAGAREWALRAQALAESGGYDKVRVIAGIRLGTAAIAEGDADGERYLLHARELALATGFPWYAAIADLNLATGLTDTRHFRRAERAVDDAIAFATERELDGLMTELTSLRALVLLGLGRWTEAEEAARQVAHRAAAVGVPRLVGALVTLGRILARRGSPEAATVLDEALDGVLPTGMVQHMGPVRAARAEAAWLAGDSTRSREEAAAALPLALQARHPWIAGELLWWQAEAGGAVSAPEWVARPFQLQLQGDWEGAATEWERLGCPYEAALARAGSGQPQAMAAALAAMEQLGADAAAHRVRRMLRQAGVRHVPRGPRPSTAQNPAGLTRREVEVAQLVAEGLQNAQIAERLFLSPKTVGHHVSAVLGKLDVRNRGEVARAAERLGVFQNREPDRPE